ncbi:MAG: patatin-like phospholipase family protein [Burkholderiales bacterium]
MANSNNTKTRTINLALQGGGSHGAYTWGVLDRLLEQDGLAIDGISGASAGAMNAAVFADGLLDNGTAGAKKALRDFWKAVSETPSASMFSLPVMNEFAGTGFDLISRVFSPYQTNPFNLNPLRDLLAKQINFARLRKQSPVKLYICATNVRSGRAKVFEHDQISGDVLLASSCLPFLFQAVEIKGEHYWDGGYMGNPPLFPLYDNTETRDIIIVEVNPIKRDDVPDKSQEIIDRLNEISFNTPLILEMRAIDFVNRLLEKQQEASTGTGAIGLLNRLIQKKHGHEKQFAPLYIHAIEAEKQMRNFGASTKSDTSWSFLQELHDIGYQASDKWLTKNYDQLGKRSTIDIAEKYL